MPSSWSLIKSTERNMEPTHPHLLLFPCPAQGHIVPLMKLAETLATDHGFNITFVNTQTNHDCLINILIPQDGRAAAAAAAGLSHRIRLVSIPDLDYESRRMHILMKPMLEKLITEVHNDDHDHGRITCILADNSVIWALEIGQKMGIKTAAFTPFSAATLLLTINVQNLINDGIIDQEGFPLKDEAIEFSPLLPSINIKDLPWMRFETVMTKKFIFDIVKRSMEKAKLAQWTIINTTQSLEPAALSLLPQARPVGPLLSGNRLGNSAPGNLYPEDLECLKWLDQQPPNSVIYAAFGSTAMFSHPQFLNLGNGLDLTNRPFLWVVRPGSINGGREILDMVGSQGKVVRWAPQEKVLGHPSVACFFTHCGWNSTIEGVSNGVPLLCWPYSADQFMNQNYICNLWRVGLGFETKDDVEIITKEEIKDRIETLVSDKSFKERALELKDSIASSVNEDGSSKKNLLDFIEWVVKN